MLAITESQLDNFWKVRDVCQEVSSSLSNLIEEDDIEGKQKNILSSDCEVVKEHINQMTQLGYFSKKEVSQEQIVKLVNSIIEIENKNAELVSFLWEKQITDIKNFKQTDFKICVKPFFDNFLQEAKRDNHNNFLSCKLISNKNICIPNIQAELFEKASKTLPAGFIYPVTKENFIAATDCSSNIVIKDEDSITDKDFLATCKKNDEFLFLNGYATKIKSPSEIIRKFSNDRFTENNNAVVIDGQTVPCAVFCYAHCLPFINKQYQSAVKVSDEMGLPLKVIELDSFYKNNGKFFTSHSLMRKCFNEYVDVIERDLSLYAGIDVWAEVKKLKGFNTNLRYNFIYKLANSLKAKFDTVEMENKSEYIAKAIKKAVVKRNELLMERELKNGGPLIYPTEEMFVPTPVEFSTIG